MNKLMNEWSDEQTDEYVDHVYTIRDIHCVRLLFVCACVCFFCVVVFLESTFTNRRSIFRFIDLVFLIKFIYLYRAREILKSTPPEEYAMKSCVVIHHS